MITDEIEMHYKLVGYDSIPVYEPCGAVRYSTCKAFSISPISS